MYSTGRLWVKKKYWNQFKKRSLEIHFSQVLSRDKYELGVFVNVRLFRTKRLLRLSQEFYTTFSTNLLDKELIRIRA